MALVRCIDHGRPKAHRYVHEPYLPYSGLGTVICGRQLCFNPGFVWLTRTEAKEYANGERRFFQFPSSAAKVAVGGPVGPEEARRLAARWGDYKMADYVSFHDGLAPAGWPRAAKVHS